MICFRIFFWLLLGNPGWTRMSADNRDTADLLSPAVTSKRGCMPRGKRGNSLCWKSTQLSRSSCTHPSIWGTYPRVSVEDAPYHRLVSPVSVSSMTAARPQFCLGCSRIRHLPRVARDTGAASGQVTIVDIPLKLSSAQNLLLRIPVVEDSKPK